VWTPSEEQAGRYAVAVVVTDGYGGSADLYFYLEVRSSMTGGEKDRPSNESAPAGTDMAVDGTPSVSPDTDAGPPASLSPVSPVPVLLLVLLIVVFFAASRRARRRDRWR
jgi:hypothetical protein